LLHIIQYTSNAVPSLKQCKFTAKTTRTLFLSSKIWRGGGTELW
jgi:hypothetical protein